MRRKEFEGPPVVEGITGTQILWRCDNGYGASVVKTSFSYGGREGLWELAVIKFLGDGDDFELEYGTPVTDNVIGWLTDQGVEDLLDQIEALPRQLRGIAKTPKSPFVNIPVDRLLGKEGT